MIDMQTVYGSSNVAAIGYDAENMRCLVRFTTGAEYVYLGVPEKVWEELQNAPSKGRFVQIVLRRGYNAVRMQDPDPAKSRPGKPPAAEVTPTETARNEVERVAGNRSDIRVGPG